MDEEIMSYINEMTIMGNIGSKPTLNVSKTGKKSTLISIVTKEKWIDKHTLEPRESLLWHKVILWDTLAQTVVKYTDKGTKIWVRGELKIRSYVDKEGVRRQRVEVVGRSIKLISTHRSILQKEEEAIFDSTDYVDEVGEISDE